jgi:CxxC motif-containing protein (DUF1111 family)
MFNNKSVKSQSRDDSAVDQVRRDRFKHNGVIQNETPDKSSENIPNAVQAEAPAAFDNLTNGFSPQGPDFDTIEEDNVNPLASFNDNRFIFEEFEGIADGLGPTYNAQSCRECHQNVVTGSGSQITEQRTGRTANGEFFESLGGSLIHSRATNARIVELVADNDNTRTFRMSLSTLGDGFIEAISNQTILAIRENQPASMRGNAVVVPVFEGNGDGRVGRFGWKAQHASLFSFSADAYLNEMGITTPTLPEENTSSGVFVGFGSPFDPVAEPEDDGVDVQAFADFMRATKAPPRGTINSTVVAGEAVFNQLSCNVCHVASITTAPAGTVINAGAMTVSPALGNKTIHPYSDFLLHNIGTGDGIPILPIAQFSDTTNQIRTPPLWGVRIRSRLMHDGLTFTLTEAIQRHRGQATASSNAFAQLSQANKNRLIAFLKSL